MLAKLVAWAPDRGQAIARMLGAIEEFAILGVTTNTAFLGDVVGSTRFADAAFTTTTVEEHYADWSPNRKTDVNLAAALAALATISGRSTASPTADRLDAADPWQTLGAWRMGSDSNDDGNG